MPTYEQEKKKTVQRTAPRAWDSSQLPAERQTNTQQTSQKWYAGENPTWRETLAQIYKVSGDDKQKRTSLYNKYNAMRQDPTSVLYDPYTQATTTRQNTTNINTTNKALREWDDLSRELSFWATSSRNYSDDEIIANIDWKKYPTLAKMDAGRESGKPLALLTSVGYSNDAMHGVIWGARNPDQQSDNLEMDAVKSVLGRGNTYKRDESIAQRLNKASITYAPYTVGGTMDDLMVKYGTETFDDKWLADNAYMKLDRDMADDYATIYYANQNTKELQQMAEEWKTDVLRKIEKGVSLKEIFNEEELESDYNKLYNLLESQRSSRLVNTTAAIDFDWEGMKKFAADAYLKKNGTLSTTEYEQQMNDLTGGTHKQSDVDAEIENGWLLNTDILGKQDMTPAESRAFKAKASAGYSDVVFTAADGVANGTGGYAEMQRGLINEANALAGKNLLNVMRGLAEGNRNTLADFVPEQDLKALQEYFPEQYAEGRLPTQEEFNAKRAESSEDPSKEDFWFDFETQIYSLWNTEAIVSQERDQTAQYQEQLAEIEDAVAEAYGGKDTDQYRAFFATYDYADKIVNQPDTFAEYDPFQMATMAEGFDTSKAGDYLLSYAGNAGSDVLKARAALENAKKMGMDAEAITALEKDLAKKQKNLALVNAHYLTANKDYSSQVKAFDEAYNDGTVTAAAGEHSAEVLAAVVNPEAAQDFAIANRYGKPGQAGMYTALLETAELSMVMTGEERSNYKYLYAAKGEEAATAYFDALSENLIVRKSMQDSEARQEWAGENVGNAILATVGSVAVSPVAALEGVVNTLSALFGKDLNPHKDFKVAMAQSDLRTGVKDGVAEAADNEIVSGIFNAVYDAVTSAGDTLVASTTGGAWTMALSAMNSSMMDARMRGADTKTALAYGAANAVIELGTEKLGMDRIADAFKKKGAGGVRELLGEMLSGFANEFGEETVGNIAGQLTDDLIMGNLSNYNKAVERYMSIDLSEEAAKAQAARDSLKEILYGGLVGGLSGGLTSGIGFAAGSVAGKNNPTEATQKPAEAPAEQTPPVYQGTEKERAVSALSAAQGEGVGEVKQQATVQGVLQGLGVSAQESSAAAKMIMDGTSAKLALAKEGSKGKESKRLAQARTNAENAQKKYSEAISAFDKAKAAEIAFFKSNSGKKPVVKNNQAQAESVRAEQQLNEAKSELDEATQAYQLAMADERASRTNPAQASVDINSVRKIIAKSENPQDVAKALTFASLVPQSRSAAVLMKKVTSENASAIGRELLEAYKVDVADKKNVEQYEAAVYDSAIADAAVEILEKEGSEAIAKANRDKKEREQEKREKTRDFHRKNAAAENAANALKEASAAVAQDASPENIKRQSEANKELQKAKSAREQARVAMEEANAKAKDAAEVEKKVVRNAQNSARMQAQQYVAQETEQRKAMEAEKAVKAEQERVAADEKRQADNVTAMEVDDFIAKMLPGEVITDDVREKISNMLQARKGVLPKNVSTESGSGTAQKFIGQMRNKFGVNIQVVDSTQGGKHLRYNGMYDAKTDTILIDQNATQSDVIYGVLLHELTHKAERSGTYKDFAKAILQIKYGGDYQKLAADIRAKQNSYNKRLKAMKALDPTVDDTPLTADDASKEIVADLTREILFNDMESIRKLCGESPSVAKRILETIKNCINKLRGVSDPALEQLNRARKLFEEALNESVEMKPGEKRSFPDDGIQYSIREEPDPVNTIKGYKVFVVFDNKPGELYPPMVANPGGDSTPVGVWLNADAAPRGADSKTGRAQVQAGGKGTQASKMSLAYRPGWHLGDLPMATQFLRKNPETGKKELFPANFVWAECECAADHDYQEEAMSHGYTKNGKFQHSLAGLPRLPREEDGTAGYYRYRTNPNPDTVPWIITGAMKVTRILDDAETDAILREAGVEPIPRQGGPIDLEKFGLAAGDVDSSDRVQYSLDDANDDSLLSPAEYRRLSSNWVDYTERGYKFAERPSGGIIVAMDNLIVYTDKDGNPVQAIEVDNEDLWQLNNIQQDLIEMEEEGYDIETQRALLEGVYGESSTHFRKGGTVPQPAGENGGGAKRPARAVRFGNRVEVSYEDEEIKPTTKQKITTDSGDVAAEVIRGGVTKQFSLSSWTEEERKTVRKALMKNKPADMDKNQWAAEVDKWIGDVDGVAAIIANDKDRLDYTADPDQVMLKDNQEYKKTLDASTLCAKRLLYQGTFNEIQHLLPNTVITSDMLLDLLNMMKDAGYESPCGVCYVESRRRHLGKFADQWLHGRPETKDQKAWKPYSGSYIPTLDELTTTDGLAKLKAEHPEAYEDFTAKMSSLGSSNPKIVQLRTDYQGDIRKLKSQTINVIKRIGGLRVQSFSDFETPHLIDMMQAVLDMAGKKLTSQAYTKVPNFAWVFGDTGIKINLSLLAEGNGLDENGNLIFSSSEGMDFDEAMRLRERYSQNVGTIIVGANDAHIRAAMADPRIDYIIPFHRSGWGQNELKKVGVLQTYTDYQANQNERMLDGSKPEGGNFYPIDYWDYNKTGDENAATYLRMCEEDGRIPKFEQFLEKDSEGHWVAPSGYWKMLIDFKMYDNDGKGAPQQTVRPEFNMEEAVRVLNEYQGGADTLPVAYDIVDRFVSEFKAANPNQQYSLPSDNILDEMVGDYLSEQDMANEQYTWHQTQKKSQFAEKTGQGTNVLTNETKQKLLADPYYTTTSEKKNLAVAVDHIAKDGYSKRRDMMINGDTNMGTPAGQVEAYVLMKLAKESGDAETEAALAFKVKESGTRIAQSLAMRRLYAQMSPEGKLEYVKKAVNRINANYEANGKGTRVEVPSWLKQALIDADGDNAKSEQALDDAYREIAMQMPYSFKDWESTWRYLAMLGNPLSHVKNLLGVAAYTPYVATRNKVSALLQKSKPQEERTRALGMIKKEYLDFAKIIAATQQKAMKGETATTSRNAMAKIEEYRQKGPKWMDKLSTLNSEAMAAEDLFWKNKFFTRSLASYLQAKGADLNDLSPEMLNGAIQHALDDAYRNTFNNINQLAKVISDAERSMEKGGTAGKVLSYGLKSILPFKNTPANVLARGVDFSPVGLARTLTFDLHKYKQGKMTADEYFDKLSAGLTGFGATALGFALASMGFLNMDEDELTGEQENSITLLGVNIGIDWMGTAAMPVLMGGRLYQMWEEQGKEIFDDGFDLSDVPNLVTMFGEAMRGVTDPMINLSMLQGVNNFVKSAGYAGGNAISALGTRAATTYASQFVPSFFGAVARIVDETRRTTYTDKNSVLPSDIQYFGQSIINKIPVLSWQGMPYMDAWGNEESNGPLWRRLLNNLLLPGYSRSIESPDEVEKMLADLYDTATAQNISGASDAKLKAAEKSFSVNGETYHMTAKEYEKMSKVRGRTAYDLLQQLMQQEEFYNGSDYYKVKAVGYVWDYANTIAKHQINADYAPDSAKWALTTKDPFGSVMEKAASATKNYENDQLRLALYDAIRDGRSDEIHMYQEALIENGVKESGLKTSITNEFKSEWLFTYEEDPDAALGLEYSLRETGLFRTKDFTKWMKGD